MALEVEDKLAGDRLHDGSGVAEEDARAVFHSGCFEKGIGHAGDGLHGVDTGANAGGGKTRGTEVAQLAQLSEVLKAVGV